MKKKIGAFGAGQFSLGTLVGGRPGTTIFQSPGGGGGGGWGVSHTRTGPGCPPPPPPWLHPDAEALLLRRDADLRAIQQAGVHQGDEPPPPPPPPRKEGAHAHAVLQACKPCADKLRTGLLQVSDVGRRANKVCDEARDHPRVRPQAPVVGTDDAEAANVRGAAPHVF